MRAGLVAALVATVWILGAAYARPSRPPLPDALTPALEAERRVLYLVNEIGAEPGDPRVCVCEPASVGTAPAVRRAGR